MHLYIYSSTSQPTLSQFWSSKIVRTTFSKDTQLFVNLTGRHWFYVLSMPPGIFQWRPAKKPSRAALILCSTNAARQTNATRQSNAARPAENILSFFLSLPCSFSWGGKRYLQQPDEYFDAYFYEILTFQCVISMMVQFWNTLWLRSDNVFKCIIKWIVFAKIRVISICYFDLNGKYTKTIFH